MPASTSKSSSDLYSSGGVEFPTHTTPHNQVVIANIPDPSSDTMSNYLQLKKDRDCSWEDIASNVEVQDPALAEYLRTNGAKFEADQPGDPALPPLLTELAINPLSTPEDRDPANAAGIVTPTAPAAAPAAASSGSSS